MLTQFRNGLGSALISNVGCHVQALYSGATGEVEVLGTPGELRKLAGALQSDQGSSFELDLVDDPAPYTASLCLLVVVMGAGKVAMEVSEAAGKLQLSGGPLPLSALGDVVVGFAREGDPTSHLHVEGFPGHEFLAEDLQGLVLGLGS